MRLLRFLIAASCGVIATVCVLEHRGPLERWLEQARFGRTVPQADAAFQLAEAGEPPLRVVPVPLSLEPESAAPPATSAREPRWRIVDAGLEAAREEPLPARTVSDTAPQTAVIATAAKTAPQAAADSSSKPKWEILGHSAGRRPIHVRRAGQGSDITLIVAGLDGEDRIAVKWVDQLSQRIDEAPELVASRQIVLLRAVNPDGLTFKRATNDGGVMINRNFPTAAYRPGGQPSAGAGPASEPETRVVLQLLADLRPQRIIHVQSSHQTAAISNVRSPAVIHSYQELLHAAPQTFDPQRQPGSLEDYAATVLGLDVLSLQLPTGDDWRAAGLTHVPTLLAMAEPLSAAVTTEAAPVALKDPATDATTDTQIFREVVEDAPEDIAAPPRRGYEELPPPPFKPSW